MQQVKLHKKGTEEKRSKNTKSIHKDPRDRYITTIVVMARESKDEQLCKAVHNNNNNK